MLPWIAAALGLGAAGYVARRAAMRRAEAECDARLPVGPDGIIPGSEPVDRPGTNGRAVLVLHGFGDSPHSVRYLVDHLHGLGYAVRAPLFPGHGRRLADFAQARAEQWVEFARAELNEMRTRYGDHNVALVGLSMGGALAATAAAKIPDLPVLVLIAPYLAMPPRLQYAARLHPLISCVSPYLRGKGERSIHDPAEAALSRHYGVITPRLGYELLRVVQHVRQELPRVTAPTLVIASRLDNRIGPDASQQAFYLLGCAQRRIEFVENTGHVITVDYQREQVFQMTAAWIAEHMEKAQGAPPKRPSMRHPRIEA